jgi:hypothetical protein
MKRIVEYITLPESEIREFDNKSQLDKYFNDHYDELKDLTTHRLNQMFRLSGYKIVKRKGNIKLLTIREDIKTNHKKTSADLDSELDQIRTKIKQQDELTTLILNTLHEHNMLDI